jgi:hypothetical protein
MNMRMITKVSILLAALSLPLAARQTQIEMAVNPAAILIGEQAIVTLTLTADEATSVAVLLPEDTLMRGVEILEVSPWDTLTRENGRVTISRELLITSFDSSLYLLPSIVAATPTDTAYSNQEALKVSTVPDVDVEHPENFFDLKPLWEPPFVWKDYLGFLLWLLLALLVGGAAWYVFKRWKQHKSLLPQKEAPKIPPHERAIQALEEVKQQKLWQQGKYKEYYTGMTDALRHYIYERFDIDAMEMTSSEILGDLRAQHDAAHVHPKLAQLLTLADFVKFAKTQPLPDENDLSMANAFLFVEQTKVVPTPDQETDTPASQTADNVQPED